VKRAARDVKKVRPDPDPERPPTPEDLGFADAVAHILAAERHPNFAFANCKAHRLRGKKGRDDRTVYTALTLRAVARDLFWVTGGWPRRVGNLLFTVRDHTPLYLEDVDDLFAWVGAQQTKPIHWEGGPEMVSRAVLLAHLRQSAERFEAVETLPHWPPLPGHYYTHPPLGEGDGGALDALVDRFQPATPTDRALIKSMLLTPFWGGAPGTRPAFLVEADDDDGRGGRGTGKTTLAKMVAHAAGGHFDVRQGEDLGRMLSRLLTPAALPLRVVLLDNLKTLRLSWADVEALITNDTVNGHRLYCGDARRPNTLTWVLTLNGASLSKDLAQRCVIVRVKRPTFDATWEAQTRRFIDEHRWALIADVLALLQGPKASPGEFSRWAAWEAEVLAACPDPAACRRVIAERQAAVDGDQEDSDLVRDAFAALLRGRGHDPDKAVVFIPSAEAARAVNDATGEDRPTQRATGYLGTLAILELRKTKRSDRGGRGWTWTGRGATPGAAAVPLNSWGRCRVADPADSPFVAKMKATAAGAGG
jgi:hypothetical protein